MEAAVVSALMTNIVARLFAVLEQRYDQLSALHDDIDSMKAELHLIAGAMEDQLAQKGPTRAVERISMTVLRELAFDIEDCLDRFLPCAACGEEAGSIGDPVYFVDEIQKLKKRLEGAHQQKTNYGVKGGQQEDSQDRQGHPVASHDADTFEEHHHHVGIEKPKQEVVDLLEVEGDKMMVISIVGFGGSGKTALAKAVYHCPQVRRKFLRRAWVVASKHKDDAKGLLTAILQQLLPSKARAVLPTQQVPQLQQHIIHHLQARSTRCLIVIDDMEHQHWKAIEPIIVETSSRILVTTTIHSVANKCSSAGGYVYNMRTLSAEDSTVLLKKKVSLLGGSSPDLEDGSAAIVHKCDGHPLALVSVANHLLGESELTGKFCKDTSSCLGSHMDKNTHGDFTKLRQVLVNNYSSLSGGLKTCLLYTSLFPNGRPVSRKTLTRRWLAEGYIDGDLEAADKNFKELIDRNIIQSIDESNDGKSKTCKPHGIMHQFMLHKSMSCNFVTSFGDKNRRRFRHLVMENHTNYTTPGMDHAAVPTSRSHNRLHNLVTSVKEKFANISTFTNTGLVCKQLRPRSLTIFGGAGEAVSDLTSCELLRVLDLKECVGLNEEHLGYIYKLLHLKYLTLGSSVCNLSVEMERLHCLETLDVRNTQIETLPVEVINLPHLAHLFGKIKLNKISSKNGKKFMQGKSNLQTLAGVVVDSNSGFPELMVHMKKLTKIKLWCEISSTYRNYTILSEAIHRFVQAGMGNPVGDRSLSLHINDCSKDLLHHHQVDNTTATSTKHVCVSSLKLQGSLSQFIQFVTSLRGLKELCLTSTNLTRDDLSTLFTLKLLVYLKLVEVHLAVIDILNLGNFRSLQRLRLVVQEPGLPTIQQGALLSPLVSLQLLCKDLLGPSDHLQMKSFGRLQEIALDSMVSKETIELWENEARMHPKRPRILLLKRVGPAGKYVATDQGSLELPMPCGCSERCCHADQGSPEA
uniref:Disease resistance protein RPM1 n=3 Tax=Triticum urartu TaxID=4572 RepID=A0A8R7TBS4_TRIUA